MRIRVAQYTPIMSPENQLGESLETISELLKLSGKLPIEHPFLSDSQLGPKLKIIDPDGAIFPKPTRSELQLMTRFSYKREWLYLKTTLEVAYGNQAHKRLAEEVTPPLESDEQYTSFASSVASESLKSFIEALVTVANLARPGTLEVGDSQLFINNSPSFGNRALVHSLAFAVDYATKTSWPQIKNLDIEATWRWAQRNNLFDSFGMTPVERAYNAFTYLLTQPRTDEVINLFWALVGIEALYAKGTSGVQQQILEKTQVLLGRRETFKKHLSEMYQVRSRFIHGDLPFPGQFYHYDASPEFEKFTDKIGQATELATVVLIASLQMLVEKNWNGLNFSYKLD